MSARAGRPPSVGRHDVRRRSVRQRIGRLREGQDRLGGVSIRIRLMILTAVMCVLVVVGGTVALVGLRDNMARTEQNISVVGPALDENRAVLSQMASAQAALRGYLVANLSLRAGVTGGGNQAGVFLDRFSQAQSAYSAELTKLDGYLTQLEFAGDEDARHRLADLRSRQRTAIDAWWEYSRASRSTLEVSGQLFAEGDNLYRDFESTNQQLSAAIMQQRDRVDADMQGTLRSTQERVLLATLGALVLASLLGWWTMRDLTRPLKRLQQACREQAAGSRTAWADEQSGTREVRGVAVGLNALTRSQQALADEQAYALTLSQMTRELGRHIQDASDVESAFVMAVEGVGQALLADQTATLVTQVVGGDRGICAVWTPDDGVALARVSDAALDALQDDVRELWNGERCLVVDDVAQAMLPLPIPEEHWYDEGSAIIAAFGSGETPRGVMSIRAVTASRGWTATESTFVQAIAAELGRAVEAAEVGRARREHVTRLEELDRQKDAFLSTVSHELRTPLTSINGYLELLEDGDAGDLSEDQRHMLAVIDRNAVRLRGLIEDLLLINRMRDGDVAGDELVPLDRLVQHAAEELAPLARSRSIRLEVATTSGASVRGNAAQLARVVTNVLSNAVKFTAPGNGVRLRTLSAVDGRTVRIVCSDEGMGIPAAEQERLFTRFFRASNATRNEVPGTGLGLVVVKGIIEAHGGRLQLSSTEGVGTTVLIELPVGAVVPEPA